MDSDGISPRLEARLGRDLKAARLRAGLTQRELATRAGVALAFLAQIESGASNPDLRMIGALAKAVGRAACELLQS